METAYAVLIWSGYVSPWFVALVVWWGFRSVRRTTDALRRDLNAHVHPDQLQWSRSALAGGASSTPRMRTQPGIRPPAASPSVDTGVPGHADNCGHCPDD